MKNTCAKFGDLCLHERKKQLKQGQERTQEEEKQAGQQQKHKRPLVFLKPWALITTVSPRSQKCLFNKQTGKLILHMTHL